MTSMYPESYQGRHSECRGWLRCNPASLAPSFGRGLAMTRNDSISLFFPLLNTETVTELNKKRVKLLLDPACNVSEGRCLNNKYPLCSTLFI